VDVVALGRGVQEGLGDDGVEGNRLQIDGQGTGSQPAHGQQIVDEGVEAVGGLFDGGQQFALLVAGVFDVGLAQAGYGGFDAGQWGCAGRGRRR
jgi:hypothetical protein